jgi:hypothetical protein
LTFEQQSKQEFLMTIAVDFDPLLKLQLEELQRFLKKVETSEEASPVKLRSLAEHICEWTRTILSRSFGRIGELEALELRDCFQLAATIIDELAAPSAMSTEDRDAIVVYADHVRNRVRHLPLAN